MVLYFFSFIPVPVLRATDVAVGAITEVEVRSFLENSSAAQSFLKKFAIGGSNVSPDCFTGTFLRHESNVGRRRLDRVLDVWEKKTYIKFRL